MKLVFGKGFNDVAETVRNCPYYKKWVAMLDRCYNTKKHEKRATYHGVTVCDEWLTFSNFKSWMEKQDWKGKQLDKDLIKPGNKTYCPAFCVFLNKELNNLFHFVEGRPTPLGVYLERNAYRATIKRGKVKKYLGTFPSSLEAHLSWNRAKRDYLLELISKEQDTRIRSGLLLRVDILDKAYIEKVEIYNF